MPRLTSLWSMLLILAACGGGGVETADAPVALPEDALVIVVSSDLSIGRHRVAIGALSSDQSESLVVDAPVEIEFYRPDGSTAGTTTSRFIWAVENARGLWITDFEFDTAGIWTIGVRTAEDSPEDEVVESVPFKVALQSASVAIGEQAPRSDSKTTAHRALGELTSDPNPDPRFYELSVAEAVESGQPTVIVFATPAFCSSATCGPVLDVAKTLIDDFPEINWIHVEVYTNLDVATLDELVLEPTIVEWRLMSEPWVFVIDAGGTVVARFEGAIGSGELANAVSSLSAS